MQFYILASEPIAKRQIELMDAFTVDGPCYGVAPRCTNCGKYIGMRPWLPPYRVDIETWGIEFGDLAFPTSEDILVSLRFKELWEGQVLTGLSGFEPVDIVKVKRHRKFRGDPPPYFRADVAFSRTAIDLSASEFEWDEAPTCTECLCGGILKRWKRVIVDQATWAGEDIFIPRGINSNIATERFKEWCEINNMKNATFIPAEEYGHDFYPWEKQAK